MEETKRRARANSWWYVLVLIPLIGTLFPSFYSSVTPRLWGIPFFYWYQLLWVIISALVTFVMYRMVKE